MDGLKSGYPAQPNLDVSTVATAWSLKFWLITSVTGAAAGIAGGLLMRLLSVVEKATWQYRSGTLLEAAAHASSERHIVALLIAGALIGVGGVLIRKYVGRGGDVEAAIWFHGGSVPALSTSVRAVHSIVTVGLGTSLGRESPIKQAGGAIASRFGVWFGLTRAESRLLTACGVGAGMAAAYNVPVGGALFAVEVLLGSIALRLAFPALLCSGVATAASWIFLPTDPVYRVPEYPLSIQLTIWALIAGPLLGLATVPLVQAIGWASSHKPRGTLNSIIVPIIVLTALGFASIKYPQLLGNGKDDVQLAFLDQFSLSLLLVLPVLKLISTAACLGSGASGGLFTPTMTIGAMMGGLLGHLWNHIYPGASIGSCSVIGACAFVAAASQGPISALVLVLELARHVDATMVPMLLAVTGAVLVAREIESRSIYSIRLPGGRRDGAMQFVAIPTAFDQLISSDFRFISAATNYAEVARLLLTDTSQRPLFIVDHEGHLMGCINSSILTTANVGAMPIEATQAGDLAHSVEPIQSDMQIADVLSRIDQSNWDLPVIDAKVGTLFGVICKSTRGPEPAN